MEVCFSFVTNTLWLFRLKIVSDLSGLFINFLDELASRYFELISVDPSSVLNILCQFSLQWLILKPGILSRYFEHFVKLKIGLRFKAACQELKQSGKEMENTAVCFTKPIKTTPHATR